MALNKHCLRVQESNHFVMTPPISVSVPILNITKLKDIEKDFKGHKANPDYKIVDVDDILNNPKTILVLIKL